MALRVTFIGPPNSGKRTQARALRQNGFIDACSSEPLRAAIAAGAAPASDDILLALVRDAFDQHRGQSIVLAGFPRTVRQAEQLAGLGLDAALFFDASDETMQRRVGDCIIGPGGHVHTGGPPPSQPPGLHHLAEELENYAAQLAVYRQQEAPLRAFYTGAGLAHSVLAAYPQATVRAQIADVIAGLNAQRARRLHTFES